MKTLMFLVGMMTGTIVLSQTHSVDDLAFQNAVDLYEKGCTDDALLAFYEFMNVYPQSPLRASAHLNIGYLQFERNHYEASAFVFRQILDEDYNDRDPNNLMEPYMLYKHQSCRMLAEISLQQKDFEAAEEYIRLFDDVYPYQHFCGNELSAYAIYAATMKARTYEGQGKITKAVQALAPFTFSDGLASNQELLELFINILFRNYSQEEIQKELNQSIASIRVNKKNRGATLQLFGKEVTFNEFSFEDDGHQPDMESYQKLVKENFLYKRFL